MDEALGEMAERVGSKNFEFVDHRRRRSSARSAARSPGLFDMVAETVRQRQQFARKIKALTAMGRMSAYVLVGLPFFIAACSDAAEPGLHGAALPHARRATS